VLDGRKFDEKGLLRPCKAGEQPTDFGSRHKVGRRKAEAAINRSVKFATAFLGRVTLIDDTPGLADFRQFQDYVIVATPSAEKVKRRKKETLDIE
jgi:hypothetical protein